MEKEQDYIVLLDRFLKGGTSPEEEKDLLDWFRKTAPEAIVSKIIFRSKNIVRPISQLVEKQMNYS